MVGILAYGSLICDPGSEIQAVIVDRIEVETPFKIEFARSSQTRDGAPTLVPVEEGGARVNAVVLVLEETVTESEAKDMLYWREICQVSSRRRYNPPVIPGPNTVLIERLTDFAGLDVVLYTKIAADIDSPTPEKLAELTIESAKAEAGDKGKDGISYLICAKQSGIVTPLMPEYEKEILRQMQAETLEEARAKSRRKGG